MIDVTEPTTVEVDALVQAVHPVGYASFVRAELVHRTPGTSPDELLRGRGRGRRRRRPRDRRRRHQRGDRVRGLRPHEPRPARHAGPAGQGGARREPQHHRRRQRRRSGAPAVARRGAVRGVGVARRPGVARGARRRADRRHRTVRAPAVDAPRARVGRPGPRRDPGRRRRRLRRGGARRVPVLARPRPDACRPVRARPRLDDVGVRVRHAADARPRGGRRASCWTSSSATREPAPVARSSRSTSSPPRPPPAGERPVRWLGGFTVVHAEPGAHERVQVRVDARTFRTWDTALPGWVTPPVPTRSAWAVRQATYVSRSTSTFRVPPTGPDAP